VNTALRFIANVIVVALLWVISWFLLDLVPGFSEPIISSWSAAKLLSFSFAVVIITLNRHKFPWLRLCSRR
jgi:drug/metabolite transporter (DMT)-like permease